MRNVVLAIFSCIFVLLSIFTLIDRLIVPTISNAKYEKEKLASIKEYKENYEKKLEEQKEKEEKIKHETVKVENPENDSEIIAYVIGEYFARLSTKQYEKSYDLLYSGFKSENFPNIDKYKEYCSTIYKDIERVEYLFSDRKNNIIIVKVVVYQFGTEETVNQTFSIIETSENVYKISFGLGEE